MSKKNKKTYTLDEAAEEIGCKKPTIYTLASQDKLTKRYYTEVNFVIVCDKKFSFEKKRWAYKKEWASIKQKTGDGND